MKLIDLNHKALIFLDTPNHTLLEAIMSLLSHDHHEVEYHFVDLLMQLILLKTMTTLS